MTVSILHKEQKHCAFWMWGPSPGPGPLPRTSLPDGKLHIEGTLNGAREGVMLTRGQPGALHVGRQRTDERAGRKSEGKIEEKGTHICSAASQSMRFD